MMMPSGPWPRFRSGDRVSTPSLRPPLYLNYFLKTMHLTEKTSQISCPVECIFTFRHPSIPPPAKRSSSCFHFYHDLSISSGGH